MASAFLTSGTHRLPCPCADFIVALAGAVSRVVLLDHHKTAQEDIAALAAPPPNLEVHFDMARSGASLARDYFGLEAWLHGRSDKRAAGLLRMIALVEDNDLWRHALPESRAFTAGLAALALEYDLEKNPTLIAALAGLDADALIAAGAAELEKQRVAIESDLAAAAPCSIPGPPGCLALRALAVVTRTPQYRSELGNQLAAKSEAAGLDAVGARCCCFFLGCSPSCPPACCASDCRDRCIRGGRPWWRR